MKRNINYLNRSSHLAGALIVSAGLFMASCTGNFEKTNTNPNGVTEKDMQKDFLFLGGYITQMEKDIVPTSDQTANEFQRAQNLTGDIFSGQQAAIGEWNASVNNSTYSLAFGPWNDVAFSVAYTNEMSAWLQVKKAAEADYSHVYALATILKVAAMHRITDNYGPIPYSKFGTTNKVAYDSQQDVYTQFFTELDWATGVLKQFVADSPGAMPMKKFDVIYGGDYTKWIKFANSLKLRLAMRIRFADAKRAAADQVARKYAEDAIAAGVFMSNADNALLQSYNGVQIINPLNKCWDAYGDTRMGANMDSYLNGYSDDRRTKYFTLCEDNTSAANPKPMGYYGVRNGLPDHNKANFIMMSHPAIDATTPVIIMTAAEMKFLMAEAATLGWNVGGATAQSLYEGGITLSFQQWGSSLPSTYLTSTANPITFTDRSMNPTKYSASAVAPLVNVAWNEAATLEVKLQRIITQKWIALYPDGQEAWSEFRRTTYPKLIAVSANNSSGTINSTTGIRRVIYPTTEYNGNIANVQAAIVTLGQESYTPGAVTDNGGVKVWWDKK